MAVDNNSAQTALENGALPSGTWHIDPTAQATTVANGQSMQSSLLSMFNSNIATPSNTSLSNEGSTVVSPGLANGAIVEPGSNMPATNPISNMLLLVVLVIAGFIFMLNKGKRK